MRIAITGSNGQLGKELVTKLSSPSNIIFPIDVNNCDITDRRAILPFLNKSRPGVIMHCAAYTDVDGCERDPELAKRVNVEGTKNLSDYAMNEGITLIHVSTDYVFDGTKKGGYTEEDQPNPISVYGRTKLEGEEIVKAKVRDYFIIRTAWLYGQGNNFVTKIIELARKNKVLEVVDDQFGSPTYAKDLAYAMCELISSREYGTYHIVNSGSCSRFDFAAEILRKAGIETEVVPVSSSGFKTLAVRPNNSVLSISKIEGAGIRMRNWKEALWEYLETYYKDVAKGKND